MTRRLVACATAVVLAASLLGACSGSSSDADPTTTTTAAKATSTSTTTSPASSDGVPVDDWAKDFCGSFATWSAAIQKAGAGVGNGVAPGDVNAAKQAIVGLFATAGTYTDALIDATRAAGTPDVADGDQLVDDIQAGFEDFQAAVTTASGKAKALSTADPTTFQRQVDALVADFQSATTKVGSALSAVDAKYPSRDLQEALTEHCSA